MQRILNERWNVGLEASYHTIAIDGSVNVVSQAFWSDDRSYATYFTGEAYTDTELKFIELPLKAYHKFNERWSMLFGAYYSIILDAKLETEGKNGWLSTDKEDTDNAPLPGIQDTKYSFNDDLDNYDFGGLIGMQYKMGQRFMLWGRFNLGFKSIFKPEFQRVDPQCLGEPIHMGFQGKYRGHVERTSLGAGEL